MAGEKQGLFDAVNEAFLAAAIGEGTWAGALDEAVQSTGSLGALLLPIEGRFPGIPISSDFEERANRTYFEPGWHLNDQRVRGLPVLRRKGVMVDADFASEEEVKRGAYWQDFLVPAGFPHFAGVSMATANDWWCLALQRSREQGAFTARELQRLGHLSRTLSRSASLAQKVADAYGAGAAHAFDLMQVASLLLNRRGEVVRLNGEAEALARSGAITIKSGRMTMGERGSDLEAMIGRLALGRRWDGPILARSSTGDLFAVSGLSMMRLSRTPFGENRILLILESVPRRRIAPSSILRSAFNLSPAEAEIAMRAGQGMTIEAMADDLTVSRETVRSHVKAVFLKMDCRRQSELALMVSSLQLHYGEGP